MPVLSRTRTTTLSYEGQAFRVTYRTLSGADKMDLLGAISQRAAIAQAASDTAAMLEHLQEIKELLAVVWGHIAASVRDVEVAELVDDAPAGDWVELHFEVARDGEGLELAWSALSEAERQRVVADHQDLFDPLASVIAPTGGARLLGK